MDRAALTDIARAHLEPEVADRWLAMLKNAVRLIKPQEPDTVIARLGGRPVVPEGFEWPVWDGVGPLSFIGEIDLEALKAANLDPGIGLPSHGRLLAFYFDGSYNDFSSEGSTVGTWAPETLAGARLIHLDGPRTHGTAVALPNGVVEFPEQEFCGRQVTTHPGWEHPVLSAEFGADDWDLQTWRAHPIQGDAFNEALFTLDESDGPRHQIGGWAVPVQGPVELEVADAALAPGTVYGSPAHRAEANAWNLLLQVDSDDTSEMMWGDVGSLYWLRRDSARGASDMGPVSFTWQCG